MKKLFLLSLIFLLPSLVLANGLSVSQPMPNVTKIFGNDITYNFQIINQDSFPFYNITIENNNLVYVPTIPQLNPGQIVNVSSIITANQSFDLRSFKIKGYYYINVGVSNTTHPIDVDYYNGLSRCDFTIIRGDKIIWSNKVPDEVDLKNAVTGNIVTTIPQGANYSMNFESPDIFKYYFLRRGFIFTPVCTITALSDNGLVNNPELDGFLNISLSVIYNPTNMTYNILENNYTLNVFQSQDGVLTLTNAGNQTARNIKLEGEWLSFNANNFDLEPGITKGIVYTIRPVLAKTEDTNKSYVKTLSISGNFATISLPFNIFVNFANLNDSNLTSNYQSLMDIIQIYCRDNPEVSFCKNTPTVVYVGNETNSEFNVTYSQDQVKKIYSYIFSMGDDQKTVNNFMKDSIYNLTLQVMEIKNLANNNTQILSSSEKQREISTGNTTIIIIVFIMLGLLGVLILIIFVIKRYKNSQKINKW